MGRFAALLALAASLLAPAAAAGAPDVGALTPVECFNDTQAAANGCPISQPGLDGAAGVAVSPNGKSVYAVASGDRAILRYDRSPSGTLTSQGCISDFGDAGGCGVTQQGLQGANDVVVSPDGKSVYAVATGDRAIVRFDRNVTTGALTAQGCISDPGGGEIPACGANQQGLSGAYSVAISPDGKSVYAVSTNDNAIVRFDRDTSTGALTGNGCIEDFGGSIGCGATQQGLSGARSVVVSPDGKSVYVAGTNDSAVVRFDRNTTTGALTPAGCISDAGDPAACGATQQGLQGAFSVAISPDGKSVYAGSTTESAVVQFDRNTTSGALTGVGCIGDAGPTGCGSTQEGLGVLISVDVSSDGKSLYATSVGDNAIVRFNRNTATGALSGVGCVKDVGGAAGCTTTQQGLSGAGGVAVSPDGNAVYVGSSNDDALVTFSRVTDSSNHSRISLPPDGDMKGLADLYPSEIAVSGLDAKVADVNVTLEGFNHTYPADMDVVLEGPGGQRVLLMSQAGSFTDAVDADLTFDDSATGRVLAPVVGGTYLPTNEDSNFIATSPAPYCNPGPNEADPQAACLTQAYRGTNPNGTWRLYATDVGDGDTGFLARGWSLDITTDVAPPETTIDSGPSGTIATSTASFAFSSSETGSTFECSLDGGAFATCASPHALSGLADGSHTFAVRATDPTGNVDATPASRSFTVDTSVPPVPDTKLDGSATAVKKQKVKKVAIAVAVTANEALTAKASGTIKLGKSTIALKPLAQSVGPGDTTLTLKPAKGKDAKKILKALKSGKKAKASVTVELTDAAGNSAVTKLGIKLNFEK
ncbi:MAG: beta-propeller fold lactonase family protein [Solirubrobacterales bacterium]